MTAVGIAASWGVGFSALVVATWVHAWPRLSPRAQRVTGAALLVLAAAAMWSGVIARAVSGHGWPFVSPADRAAGIVAILLPTYLAWQWLSGNHCGQLAVGIGSILLLAYGLGQYPQGPVTGAISGPGQVMGEALNLVGGGFLALAAAVSVGEWAPSLPPALSRLALAPSSPQGPAAAGLASENLVRAALFCMAASLAIDTWLLQKVGLGSTGDAQQAGIAVAWMVYFGALRLRSHPRWRGWPWAAVLAVGFLCTLPILIRVPWLEATLPL